MSLQARTNMSLNHADFSGKNSPMYGKGYLLKGKRNGMYGVHRYGKNNPNWGKFKKDKICLQSA
jgi:hypothetical protein